MPLKGSAALHTLLTSTGRALADELAALMAPSHHPVAALTSQKGPAMNESTNLRESICDLPLVTASYRWVNPQDGKPGPKYRIKARPGGTGRAQFDVDPTEAEQFAAELEALAALIRAHRLRPES
jgi:hypothetical protein